jgi:glucose/arabinose dehydrogenase
VLASKGSEDRRARFARIGLAAIAVCIVWALAPSARATTLPSGFTETTVISNLSSPTAFAFAPDGRIFVCEQAGALKVFDANGNLLATAVTISTTAFFERGLLGIALDPDFASNNFVYVYYTATTGSLNPPPSPKNRVSRFTMNGNTVVPGSETILLDLIPSDAGNHNAGQLRFGTDGKLYISTGDGGSTPSNSQSLTTLAGKILRLNKNGTIPTDNPYFNDASPAGLRKEIYCIGLRNPWRFTFQPGTQALFVADVGQNTWEEVNVALPRANYGWPTAEGTSTNPAFTNPIFAYNHNGTGASISGGAFYAGTTYPTEYHGNYFYGDYVDGYIRRLTLDDNNVVLADEPFATAVPSPVSIEYHNNAIWYACYAGGSSGTIRRATFTGGANRSPVAQASASPIAGLTPLDVQFSSAGSSDPDGHSLSYSWDFGDGTMSTLPNPTKTYTGSPRTVTARLTVTDNGSPNLSDTSTPITIWIGNRAPTAAITSPSNNSFYNAGQTINFSGTATDPEDGTRPASAFTWRVVFHHAEHTHPFLGPLTGVTSGSFTIPDTGETATDVFYEIRLTVTDSQGAPTTVVSTIFPNVASLMLRTSPSGGSITLDGQPMATPITIDSVVGMKRTLGVPLPQMIGGTTYTQFGGWSDGGAQEHVVTTPAGAATYTAVLVPQGAPPRIAFGGDWNDDGVDTVGLYFQDSSTFALKNTNAPGNADLFFIYGLARPGLVPLVGDWNGDGTRTPGIFDPATNTFFLRNSNSSGNADVTVLYGPAGSGWTPIVGDWDGDGDDTIGLYDPSIGNFFLRNANTPGPANLTFTFGVGGPDIVPIVGDWDGNGTTTVGIFTRSGSTFFLKNSNASGNADLTFIYGSAGSGFAPVVGNWDGVGGDTIGLYDVATGSFFLRNTNSSGNADLVFLYGPAGN